VTLQVDEVSRTFETSERLNVQYDLYLARDPMAVPLRKVTSEQAEERTAYIQGTNE
jgi:hypothetical protein